MDITLKQLEIFEAVIVAGSITKASRRIGLSQPSISQQLAKLEEKLGTPLLLRNHTGVISLTPAGEYWAKAGRELLGQLQSSVTEHNHRFSETNVLVRMGVTPTLRGRFAAAAGRIASEQPGFAKFELRFAVSSSELVEQLMLHRINFAVVNKDAIESDRASFHIADLFEDPIGWVVPAAARFANVREAVAKGSALHPSMRAFVEVDANSTLMSLSTSWYSSNFPDAAPMYATNTYATAVDLVAEGLATTHSPLSLVPNLPASIREKVRIFPVGEMTRTVVLAMPKHLYTLPAYSEIFRRILLFCQTEYSHEMLMTEAAALSIAV